MGKSSRPSHIDRIMNMLTGQPWGPAFWQHGIHRGWCIKSGNWVSLRTAKREERVWLMESQPGPEIWGPPWGPSRTSISGAFKNIFYFFSLFKVEFCIIITQFKNQTL